MPGASFKLRHRIIRAVAGAGKTRGLIEHVAEFYREFVKAHDREPQIIMTTFTVKATHEIRERLIDAGCSIGDPNFLQYVANPQKLHISTIHGVFSLFLNQVGHLSEMDAGYRVISETEATSLARRVLRDCLVEDERYFSHLEMFGFSKLLKICREYARKKRTLRGLKPGRLQDLVDERNRVRAEWHEFFAAKAQSMRGKVESLQWNEYIGKLLEASEILKTHGGEIPAFPKLPVRSKKTECDETWKTEFEHIKIKYESQFKSDSWNMALWPQLIEVWQGIEPLLSRFHARVLQEKRMLSAKEIEDLEFDALDTVRDSPQWAEIFAADWDYWMIDEYQDTSPVQVEILQALSSGRPTYRVGDPQQSIYLFRGSEVRVFEEAESWIESQQGDRQVLLENYRSLPALLNWINAFVGSVSDRFESMRSGEKDHRTSLSEHPAFIYKAQDLEGEIQAALSRVSDLVRAHVPLESICILARKHKELAEFGLRLRELGYPVQIHASKGFSDRREVLDARSIWKFLVHPYDDINLVSLMRSPWFFVREDILMEWTRSAGDSLWEYLKTVKDAPEPLLRLRILQEQAKAEGGLLTAFESALMECGLMDLSLYMDPTGRAEANLWKLLMQARDLEKRGGVSLLELMGGDDSLTDELLSEGDAVSAQAPNSIQLMTIHASKGLQFDHVILLGLGERPRLAQTESLQILNDRYYIPIPNFESEKTENLKSPCDLRAIEILRERELEEQDRVLYVALTRAQHSVTLVASQIEVRSWAERSHLFRLPDGVHETGGSTFHVMSTWCKARSYQLNSERLLTVRARWSPVLEAAERRISFSRLNKSTSVKPSVNRILDQRKLAGIRAHRYLQMLKFREPSHHLVPEEFKKIDLFISELNEPPVKDLIVNGEVEWGFQVQSPIGILEGQIDLWCAYLGHLYIVDYKTGSSEGESKAREQLKFYAWALRQFGNTEPIRAYLLYLSEKKVIQVEECTGEWPGSLKTETRQNLNYL